MPHNLVVSTLRTVPCGRMASTGEANWQSGAVDSHAIARRQLNAFVDGAKRPSAELLADFEPCDGYAAARHRARSQ